MSPYFKSQIGLAALCTLAYLVVTELNQSVCVVDLVPVLHPFLVSGLPYAVTVLYTYVCIVFFKSSFVISAFNHEFFIMFNFFGCART
jgi:hypothetical protein